MAPRAKSTSGYRPTSRTTQSDGARTRYEVPPIALNLSDQLPIDEREIGLLREYLVSIIDDILRGDP